MRLIVLKSADDLYTLMAGGPMVPPSGVEPELPKEPHFECGASANSAKEAERVSMSEAGKPVKAEATAGECQKGCPDVKDSDTTLPHYRQLALGEVILSQHCGAPRDAKAMAHRLLFKVLSHTALPFKWQVSFMYDTRGYWYLQIMDPKGIDNVTGKPLPWKGRKWLISEHMTNSEIVMTVFKAVMTAVEHEAREQFLYKGQAILDPHYDVDRLVELRRSEGALSERESA